MKDMRGWGQDQSDLLDSGKRMKNRTAIGPFLYLMFLLSNSGLKFGH